MTRTLTLGLAMMACLATTGLAHAQNLDWTVDNQSTHNINYIYFSTPDQDVYSDDILGEGVVVPPGVNGTVTFSNVGEQCDFDIQFVLDTKQVIEELGVNLCGGVVYTISDAQ